MKIIPSAVRFIVLTLHLESFFVFASSFHPFFKKLIPPHTNYPQGSIKRVTRNGAKFNLDISDYMQWYLYVKRVDVSWRIAAERVKRDSIVFDIGSNVGQFSLSLASFLHTESGYDIDIYAFEPNPAIFNLFVQNLSLNSDWNPKIIPVQLALGSKNGTTYFESGGRNSRAGKITDEKSEVEVKMITIDSFMAELGGYKRISFIKIDVEGFEPDVFDGAWSLITSQRPTLFFEFTPTWYRLRNRDPFQLLINLRDIQYKLWRETEMGLVPIVEVGIMDNIYQTNILAVPC